jgi:hypothetical protein
MKTTKKVIAKKPLKKAQVGGSKSPQTMKEYEKKYRKSGSAMSDKNVFDPEGFKRTSASDTTFRFGPYSSHPNSLSNNPKKKQQVEDLIRLQDKKFFPNKKQTQNPKDKAEMLADQKRMKKGGAVKKTVVKKKK